MLRIISCSNHQFLNKYLQEGGGNYYNPDPLIRFIGKYYETTVLVEGQNFTALVDSGVWVSTIDIHLVQKLSLLIHKLQSILNIEGMGRRFHICGIPSWSCQYQRLRHSGRMHCSSLSKTVHLGIGL